jgi:hypothetical protein
MNFFFMVVTGLAFAIPAGSFPGGDTAKAAGKAFPAAWQSGYLINVYHADKDVRMEDFISRSENRDKSQEERRPLTVTSAGSGAVRSQGLVARVGAAVAGNSRWTAGGESSPGIFANVVAALFPRIPKAAEPQPAACPLTIKGKESRVVIVAAHMELPSNPALIPADWELTYKLTQILETRYRENNDRVKIVSPMQVKRYMNKNPRWREAPPQDIGKYFAADYVVNLEINGIGLHEKGSASFFYKGSADISVTVTDVAKPASEGQKWEYPYQLAYPTGAAVEISEMSPGAFRTRFIHRIARDIAEFFAPQSPWTESRAN